MAGRENVFQEAMSLGDSAAWDQRWAEAAKQYRRALKEVKDDPQALTSLAGALVELQKYEEALGYYQRAASAAPEDPLPVEKAARLYEFIGEFEQSNQQSMLAAELYLKIRDEGKAIENLTRVVRLVPEHLSAHARLAEVHEGLGQRSQAVTEYLAVAGLLQKDGKGQEAGETLKHALELDPQSEKAKQALQLIEADEALPMAERVTRELIPPPVEEMVEAEKPLPAKVRDENLDPIAEAVQIALSTLADWLFKTSEEVEQESEAPQGLLSISKGIVNTLIGRGKDHAKIALHLSKALDQYAKGEEESTGDELKEAINAGLDLPAGYFLLGSIAAKGERRESTHRYLRRSSKHVDYSIASRILNGRCYRKGGLVKEASLEYLQALKMADSMVASAEKETGLLELYDDLIETQSQVEDEKALKQVIEEIEKLLVRPKWRAHLEEIREQLPTAEDGASSVPIAEVLIRTRGSQVMGRIATINQLARQGFYRTAMEEGYTALEKTPYFLPLHIRMAQLLLHGGDVQGGITKLNAIARAYSARGEPNRSRDIYRRIIETSPLERSARVQLIDQLVDRGDVEGALREYMDLADVHYRLAELDMARKTYEDALHLVQQAKVDSSWSVEILYRIADIDLQRLDWRQALRVFEQVSHLEPEDEKAVSNLVELNVRMGQEKQALAQLDNYISHLMGNLKEQKALDFVAKLVDQYPNFIFARRRLAELYQQFTRTEEAIAQWDQVGEALLEADDKEGAKKAILAILALNPPNAGEYQKLLEELGG